MFVRRGAESIVSIHGVGWYARSVSYILFFLV